MKDENIACLFFIFCVLIAVWNIANNIALYNIIKTIMQQ